MPLSPFIIIKALRQLGLHPLVLYAVYRFGLITGHYRRAWNRGIRPKQLSSNRLFSLPDREQLQHVLGEEGRRALIAEADEIALGGRFRMFGVEPVDIKLALEGPLQHWSAYETRPGLLAAFHPPHGDIKFLWDPARFGWAFILGRAYHLTQDTRYAEAFWEYFEKFTEANPAYLGPQWMNGQEAAIRMMALVWAAHVFEAAPASDPRRRGQLINSIYVHAGRIPTTLLYARSQNNNHLVTEAAAIYTAGLFFKHSKWRALGWKWLIWSFRHQISEYGEYTQHSTNYHRLMSQAVLWVNLIKQDVFPATVSQALARSAHWLFSLLDNVSGRTPNLGSNDGALIFPLSVTPYHDFRPTVQAAARAFLRTQIESGVWDEMSLWFGLQPVTKTHEPEHYLSDNLRGRDSWAYLRASRFKSRLAHMDQLHLDLWWRGINIAQDAGTYLYNARPPWDNSLVTTRVHNTVTVDGLDQMTRGGRFMVLDWVNAYSRPEISRDEDVLQRITAYHKGYHGVRHERTVTVSTSERWIVADRLLSRQPHTYRLHWLLPDWEWELEPGEQQATLRIKSPYGWVTLQVSLSSPPAKHARSGSQAHGLTLVRAGELIHGAGRVLPFEGWVAPTYGVKLPALSFALETAASESVLFASEFAFPAWPRTPAVLNQVAVERHRPPI